MTTARKSRSPAPAAATTLPLYELRLVTTRRDGPRVEIWQLPSPATPRLHQPEAVAGIHGAPWRLVEGRVLRRLARAGIVFGRQAPGARQHWPIDEDLALNLGLLFRTLAPMRNLDRLRQAAEGIEAMSREEAGYWLGMALHRTHPRRVLAALRLLLTTA